MWAQVTWTRVTSVQTLLDGGTFIMGYEATAKSGEIVPLRSKDCGATTSANGILNSGTTNGSSTDGMIDMSDLSAVTTSDYEVYISSPASGKINIQRTNNSGNFYGATSGGSSKNTARLYTSGNSNETNLTPEWSSETDNQFKLTANVSGSYKYLKYNTGSPRFAFYNGAGEKIVFYKKTISGPISVTGVSLDPTTLTLAVGESSTLTPTVLPNDASNKNVTWESDDESVATVDDDGNVTAVAKGTTQITVTTADGGFAATCDVTVTPAPPVAVTLDFTSNDVWEFPTSKTAGPGNYTNGYTITLNGPDNGYYFDNDNLLLGKTDATLTLPAFSFNVSKIKVYGTSGASGSVTFNVFVGENAVSTEATSSKVDHEFAIAADKQAAGNIYVIKVTNNNNMRITKIEIFGYTTATIAGSGYSTIAFGCGLDFSSATPAGLEAYIVPSITASAVSLSAIDEAPASTGVILKGKAGETYSIPVKAGAAAIVGTNKLQAAVAATPIDANKAYILQGGLFHLVNAASTVPAGKAYLLASDVPSSAPVLDFGFDDATGINAVNGEGFTVNGEFYNLNGQRVAQPTKGLYIVNGKKVVIK